MFSLCEESWWRRMEPCWQCSEDDNFYLFYLTWFFSVNIKFKILISIQLYISSIGFHDFLQEIEHAKSYMSPFLNNGTARMISWLCEFLANQKFWSSCEWCVSVGCSDVHNDKQNIGSVPHWRDRRGKEFERQLNFPRLFNTIYWQT